jgi:hypothetical protein
MLSKWEQRRLADIGRQLRSDKALRRVLAGPTGRERLWLAVRRRFYPTGYLVCALTYMLLAMGASQLLTLAGTFVVAPAVWVVLEVACERSHRVRNRVAGLRPR